MTVENETANRDYPLPHPDNVMKTVDVPRIIMALEMLDADMAAVFAAVAGKAPLEHQHAMSEVLGLVSALSGKAPLVHNHSIGSLTGVDFSNAASGQFARFNGTIWIPAFIQAADLAAKIIADAHFRDSYGVSVIGRSLATPGRPADIAALMNDRLLARVGDALGFVQMTLGMVPDGLITLAKLATASIASQVEAETGAAANKLMTAERTKQAIVANTSPGKIGQILQTQYTASATLSVLIPLDDTIPTNTEGTQVLSQVITPATEASQIRVSAVVNGTAQAGGVATRMIASLFRGSTCIDAKLVSATSSVTSLINFDVLDVPGTASAVTYSVRVGASISNLFLNADAGARAFGGVSKCTLILEEVLP